MAAALLCSATLRPVIVHASTDERLAVQRTAFVSAERLIDSGARAAAEPLLAGLADYPLWPYLEAQWLGDFSATADRERLRFLDQWGDTPPGRALRRKWLTALAGRNDWTTFRAAYADLGDTTLACQYRQALLTAGETALALEGIEDIWISAKSQPEACDPVFAAWRERGGFTARRIWARLRLATEAGAGGLANYLAGLVPAAEQNRARAWAAVAADPARIVDPAIHEAAGTDIGELALIGLDRWSRQNSLAAASGLARVRNRIDLPADGLRELENQIAVFHAARDAPGATQRLVAIPVAERDESVWDWGTRLHLRHRDWSGVLSWLEAMPEALAQAPRWRYWRARAQEQLGRGGDASAAYRQLADTRDYYGVLSAQRVGHVPAYVSAPLVADPERVARFAALPEAQRARELLALDRPWLARQEWMLITDGIDHADDWRAVAALADAWNWPDRSIVAMAKAGEWDDLGRRFPTPYRDALEPAASSTGLPLPWVYALTRQESLFQRDARSSAGATGLMQLLPGTGQHIAGRMGVAWRGNGGLTDPGYNVQLGTGYLAQTLSGLNHPLLATAGYNAGPARARQWQPSTPQPADLWVELIPYSETRDYVKRIVEYTAVYAHQLGTPVDLDWLLAPIPAAR